MATYWINHNPYHVPIVQNNPQPDDPQPDSPTPDSPTPEENSKLVFSCDSQYSTYDYKMKLSFNKFDGGDVEVSALVATSVRQKARGFPVLFITTPDSRNWAVDEPEIVPIAYCKWWHDGPFWCHSTALKKGKSELPFIKWLGVEPDTNEYFDGKTTALITPEMLELFDQEIKSEIPPVYSFGTIVQLNLYDWEIEDEREPYYVLRFDQFSRVQNNNPSRENPLIIAYDKIKKLYCFVLFYDRNDEASSRFVYLWEHRTDSFNDEQCNLTFVEESGTETLFLCGRSLKWRGQASTAIFIPPSISSKFSLDLSIPMETE